MGSSNLIYKDIMLQFNIPVENNTKLAAIIDKVKKDEEIETLLKMSNITAIDRLGYNDHGATHVKIVANSSLRILRILIQKGIVPSVVKNYNLQNEDAEVIVVLSSILHDLGHAIHRQGHEIMSTVFDSPIIDRILEGIYKGPEKIIVKFETLHAIYSHEPSQTALTIEGGVMKIADALDMEKGRARIPYKIGSINIHSLSAMAIDKVDIQEGLERPVKVIIHMSNPAGIFQVDDLLREKINTSGVAQFFTIEARLMKDAKESLLKKIQL